MKNLLIISFILFSNIMISQEVLLFQDVEADSVESNFGPNKAKFRHVYLGYGFIFGESENAGSNIMYGYSGEFLFGFRWKYKLNNTFSLGWDLYINSKNFRIDQTNEKMFPDTIKHDKETLTTGSIGADAFFRINFDKRGDHMGKFIDLSAYSGLVIGSSHTIIEKYDMPNSYNAERTKLTNTKLDYTEFYNYGLKIRFGLNRYVFYATYRFSDVFNSDYNYPDLPKYCVGLQIGLHR